MEKLSNRFDRVFEVVPGSIFGLLSIIIGLSGDFVSTLLYPGYNISYNMISDLGRGPGGIYYNTGIIISGIVAIPFGVYLGKCLNTEETDYKAVKFGKFSYIISAITLSLTGIFPGILDNYPIFFLHGLFAFISFTSAAVYLVLFGAIILKYECCNKALAYLGFIVAFLFIIVVLTWLPLLEWMANFGVIAWTILTASYFLYNNKKR